MKSVFRALGLTLGLLAAVYSSPSAWSEETRYVDCHRACPGSGSQVAYQVSYDDCCGLDQSFFYPCTRTGYVEWIDSVGYFGACPGDDAGNVDCHIACPGSSGSRVAYGVPYDHCCGLDSSFFYPCTRTGYKSIPNFGDFIACQ